MTINIDYQNRTPIYLQIVQSIERYVALGLVKPGEQILPVRELATSLGINPNTVKKAYTELEKNNVITTISTKGTFIKEDISKIKQNKIDEKIEKIKELIEEIKQLGLSDKEIKKRLE